MDYDIRLIINIKDTKTGHIKKIEITEEIINQLDLDSIKLLISNFIVDSYR